MAVGKPSALIVTVPKGVLVKEVLCHAILGCPHLPQVGDMVTQLLDGFDLLIQVVSLNEVTQLQETKEVEFKAWMQLSPAETTSEMPPVLPALFLKGQNVKAAEDIQEAFGLVLTLLRQN